MPTTTSADHTALLDQLQAQVNQVLEHTGRVFAAMSTNPKEPPVAQIAKLQSLLPVAENRFHDALDQLENELQLTMLVMRRDLAACKERSGQLTREPAPTQPTTDTPMDIDQQHDPDAKPVGDPASEQQHSQPIEDVVMEDAKPALPDKTPQRPNANKPPPEQPNDAKPHQPSITDSASTGDAKPANQDLHINTKPSTKDDEKGQPNDDEKAPDTAVETNNDLDSLFNDDNMSAGGLATDSGDFNFNHDSNTIDFGDFGHIDTNPGTDNVNVSSLLPGLEDYANTQSNDVDLETLFNLNSNDDNGMNAQGAGEQGDSFEELLAGFDGEVDDNPNSAANQDLDFDSLFN